jgi:hypothetical protein
VYPNQAEASREIRDHSRKAAQVDILAVRGLGLLGLNDSELRGPLTERQAPVRVRALLLDPDSPAVAVRAGGLASQEPGKLMRSAPPGSR